MATKVKASYEVRGQTAFAARVSNLTGLYVLTRRIAACPEPSPHVECNPFLAVVVLMYGQIVSGF
jgi:hypothetical protein